MRGLSLPHPRQHLVGLDFLVLAILIVCSSISWLYSLVLLMLSIFSCAYLSSMCLWWSVCSNILSFFKKNWVGFLRASFKHSWSIQNTRLLLAVWLASISLQCVAWSFHSLNSVFFWPCWAFPVACRLLKLWRRALECVGSVVAVVGFSWLWCVWLVTPQHVYLSFSTRDQTHVPWVGRQILNPWTPREVPTVSFKEQTFLIWIKTGLSISFMCSVLGVNI